MRYYERVVVSALEPKSTDILWVQPNTNNDGISFKAFVNGKWSAVSGTDAVSSVNGKTGVVVLNASDVNALPSSTVIPDVSGKEDTANKVTSLSSSSTDVEYPSAKATYDYVEGKLSDLHEQKKMDIVAASGTTLSAAVNTYYNFASEVNTLAVTLPSVTDSTHINNIVFMLTTGSTPAVTFAAPTGINVIAQDGFSIEASTTYEINAIFNGVTWVIVAMKLSTTPINS